MSDVNASGALVNVRKATFEIWGESMYSKYSPNVETCPVATLNPQGFSEISQGNAHEVKNKEISKTGEGFVPNSQEYQTLGGEIKGPAEDCPEVTPNVLARTEILGCERPEPSSPVILPPNFSIEIPPGLGLSNFGRGIEGPNNDPAQPKTYEGGGNGSPGGRPKDNHAVKSPEAGRPVVGPHGSPGRILKDCAPRV